MLQTIARCARRRQHRDGLHTLDRSSACVQTFAANGGLRLQGQDARLGRNGSHGLRACHAPARRRVRRGRLQPHAGQRRSRWRSWARRWSTAPADLADRDFVFTMVAGSEDFKAVVIGENGLLSRPDAAPSVIVDSSTVSPDASAEVRAQTDARDVALLAAPVSGNPSVVDAGKLTVVVSGPEDAWEAARPTSSCSAPAPPTWARATRPARQDLPQPDARRGRPVARRDHGARREGRRLARGLPGVPQQQRHGLDVHALQDARDREPRLHADVHARRCSTRTSTSGSRPPRSTACRCRWRPPPSRSCRR